ncbi:hypothetical protein [Flavobacterium sp.]|uniref:hypothetical protein n=1 Tax=Flavobacterium sp. TaxID=239 RepID=UPI00286DF6F5|nr:hypothetical protein [Flavobacterium sp.]
MLPILDPKNFPDIKPDRFENWVVERGCAYFMILSCITVFVAFLILLKILFSM